ncbi:unnamed protein product [Rotaria socialis]|uniref:Uncharacterized protein n=1 Tax=Rotaria socialis TaxID=392032 RepID=A0A820RAC5_9BILA|nr:unnamed protein product [Rotaria socialis]
MNRRSLSAESLSPLQVPITTNTNLSLKSKSYDRWAVICLIIATLNIMHALWVLIAPEHWYHNLPAGVPEFGPINVHFIRDLGCVFLLHGVGLVFAAFNVSYRLPLFTMNTAFYVLHMFVHVHEVVSGRIRMDETTITFTEIQPLLYRFHKLTHLTLNVRGSAENLANGYLWETSSTIIRLRTFHFIIEFDHHPLIDQSELVDEIFRSFSTPFWLDIKKWYIFITTHGIYTISCYDEQAFILPTFPPLSTSPDYKWFYSKTKRIKLDNNILLKNLNKFYNLERLDLSDEHLLSSIDNINQFIHLRHLVIHKNISNKILGDMLLHNPHINHLTISQNNFNQLFPFKTIRYLHIQNTIKIKNRTQIKQISKIFPSIRRLFIHVSSMRLIYQIINGFQHLDNGVFECQEKIQFMLPEWLKGNTRLKHNTCSFTWRREQNKFLLWINDSIEPSVPSNNDIEDSSNVIEEQRSDKCSLQ